jgi:voltage-dependent potassium channel beta subunit
VHDACHAALRRLQVEYLDLFFCHRPDPETPMDETVRAMNDLIRQGKVLYWGTSEWSADQIMQAHGVARELGLDPPAMEQPQYHMFHRERVEKEYLRLYDAVGMGTTIWSPLASGVLTGKYQEGVPKGSRLSLPEYDWLREMLLSGDGQKNLEKVGKLEPLARELDATLSQLAIAWCLLNPHVSTVILGATKTSQVEENLKALDVVEKLDAEVQGRIEKVLQNRPAPTPVN